MKLIKKVIAIALALTVILSMGSMPMLTYAADVTDDCNQVEVIENDGEVIYDEEITIDSTLASISSLDQTFTMTTYHRGADRKYTGNRLQYSITVTDANGNAVNNAISVRLYDYNHSYALADTQVDADGSRTTLTVSITPNRTYYFKYVLTYGTTRTLKVRMQIKSYNA